MPATHRRVRGLERALRSHVQTIREISLQTGKIKGGSSRQRYITLWKLFWEKRLLNKQITVAYQEGQRSGSGLPQ